MDEQTRAATEKKTLRSDFAECCGDWLGDGFPGKISLGHCGEHFSGMFYDRACASGSIR